MYPVYQLYVKYNKKINKIMVFSEFESLLCCWHTYINLGHCLMLLKIFAAYAALGMLGAHVLAGGVGGLATCAGDVWSNSGM